VAGVGWLCFHVQTAHGYPVPEPLPAGDRALDLRARVVWSRLFGSSVFGAFLFVVVVVFFLT
jgi:hypothetical protein